MFKFSHVMFNPQPEPPADPDSFAVPTVRPPTTAGLLLPAVQAAR